MNRAFRLGRLRGIPIELDASWVIIAVLVFFGFLADLWDFDRSSGVLALSATAAAGTTGFFASVLAHELSHSIVAVRRGIPVRRIRLFVFGGVSEIERDAATPGDELAITLAGPLASLVLGGMLVGVAVVAPSSPAQRIVAVLAIVNVALGVFNLLPGFPLDGGRVLRSLVWRSTGDFARATRIAVNGGRILAVLLVGAGVALMTIGGEVFGLWYVAIGWFLWRAAGAALLRLRVDEQIAGVPVSAAASPVMRTVASGTPLRDLLAAGPVRRGDIPVVVIGDGRVLGLVESRSLSRLGASFRETASVDDAMRRLGPEDVVDAGLPLREALNSLIAAGGALVIVEDGRTVGLLTIAGLERWLRHRESARPI